MGCCYAKDTGKDFNFNRYLYPSNPENEKYSNNNSNINQKFNESKISETINENINFSLTNEKIKDKFQKYISNRNKTSNENSLNYSEFMGNADKSFNNLNISVSNTSNIIMDSNRNMNLPFKENNGITNYHVKDISKINVSEFSNNNFLNHDINSKNENLADLEILKNKELFTKINGNNNVNLINFHQNKNQVNMNNPQNIYSDGGNLGEDSENKIASKDKISYKKDSVRLSKITEKSKDDEISYYDKSRKDFIINTEEYKATLNSLYPNDNGFNNISSKNETLINEKNNNSASLNVSNIRGSFSSIHIVNVNNTGKKSFTRNSFQKIGNLKENNEKSSANKIQESRERLLKLQSESIKELNKQTSLYKKGKNNEDYDAALSNIIISDKKEENLPSKNLLDKIVNEEAKISYIIDKKYSDTIVENLENKIESPNKKESLNNIHVSINNNIYNNINIINDREDKIIVNNVIDTDLKIKEKGSDLVTYEKINNNIKNNNIQVPTSNRKSRENEHYKNELKKRIDNLKSHLTNTDLHSNIPNKEEQENELIKYGLNVDEYYKYKKATDMPRQKYISPHMLRLIDKANNFMLGIVENSEKQDRNTKSADFIELDFKPITKNKKKKMKLTSYKINEK